MPCWMALVTPAASEAAVRWSSAGTLAVIALARAVAEVFWAMRSLKVWDCAPVAAISDLMAMISLTASWTSVVRDRMGETSWRASVSLRSAEALAVSVPALVAETTASDAFWRAVVSPPV